MIVSQDYPYEMTLLSVSREELGLHTMDNLTEAIDLLLISTDTIKLSKTVS